MNDEPHELTALQARVRAGWSPKYVFFWGHAASDPTQVGKECFSQWYPSPFVVDEITYPTAEHFMMSQKARLFGDEDAARAALAAPHPAAAKVEGRKVRGFVESVWEARRFAIVVTANRAKFSQHPALRDFLLATSARVLVEASPTDLIWGIGLAAADDKAQDPLRWRGQNLLGFALMAARAQIAAARQPL